MSDEPHLICGKATCERCIDDAEEMERLRATVATLEANLSAVRLERDEAQAYLRDLCPACCERFSAAASPGAVLVAPTPPGPSCPNCVGGVHLGACLPWAVEAKQAIAANHAVGVAGVAAAPDHLTMGAPPEGERESQVPDLGFICWDEDCKLEHPHEDPRAVQGEQGTCGTCGGDGLVPASHYTEAGRQRCPYCGGTGRTPVTPEGRR